MRYHRVGDRVRNRANGWFGRVLAVECAVCGARVLRYVAGRRCADGHAVRGGRYLITVAQDGVPGDRRPWCLPKNFPLARQLA